LSWQSLHLSSRKIPPREGKKLHLAVKLVQINLMVKQMPIIVLEQGCSHPRYTMIQGEIFLAGANSTETSDICLCINLSVLSACYIHKQIKQAGSGNGFTSFFRGNGPNFAGGNL
jgi:hypothetical protein